MDSFALETKLLFGFEDRNESISLFRLGRGGIVKLSSLYSAGLQKCHTALGEMTVYVTGLVTECWFNTVLAGERLYPLRDVLFLLFPHVSDPPCHTAVEISPLGRLSPPHRCLCDSRIKVDRAIYSDWVTARTHWLVPSSNLPRF